MWSRLASFATHFGASMLVMGRGGMVMSVRVWSCWMSQCWGQVGHGCVDITKIPFLIL